MWLGVSSHSLAWPATPTSLVKSSRPLQKPNDQIDLDTETHAVFATWAHQSSIGTLPWQKADWVPYAMPDKRLNKRNHWQSNQAIKACLLPSTWPPSQQPSRGGTEPGLSFPLGLEKQPRESPGIHSQFCRNGTESFFIIRVRTKER